MPFNPFTTRSFTAVSVSTNAPAASGVYGLTNARDWIYIGQSDDIQAALLGHLQEHGSVIMKEQPTGFVFELCHPAGRPARQGQLFSEYEPKCNRKRLNPWEGKVDA